MSKNQTRGPIPAVMPVGELPTNASDSVTTPSVVIDPIRLALNSVKRRLPLFPGPDDEWLVRDREEGDVETEWANKARLSLLIKGCRKASPAFRFG